MVISLTSVTKGKWMIQLQQIIWVKHLGPLPPNLISAHLLEAGNNFVKCKAVGAAVISLFPTSLFDKILQGPQRSLILHYFYWWRKYIESKRVVGMWFYEGPAIFLLGYSSFLPHFHTVKELIFQLKIPLVLEKVPVPDFGDDFTCGMFWKAILWTGHSPL